MTLLEAISPTAKAVLNRRDAEAQSRKIIINVKYSAGTYHASSQGTRSSCTSDALGAVKKTALKLRYGLRVPALNYFEDSGITLTKITEQTYLAEWPTT